jgi:hypothetical protein
LLQKITQQCIAKHRHSRVSDIVSSAWLQLKPDLRLLSYLCQFGALLVEGQKGVKVAMGNGICKRLKVAVNAQQWELGERRAQLRV